MGRRNRLKSARGRGTLEKEKPPILGLIQRSGQVVLRMLENVRQVTTNRSSPNASNPEPASSPTSTISIRVCPTGDITTRQSVTGVVNTPVMRMVTASMRFTSTPWRASGLSCGPGCAPIAEFHRKNSRSTSPSFSSPTTHAEEEKHSSGHSSALWLPEGFPSPQNTGRAKK